MVDISKVDFENTSLFAHDIALHALFAALNEHQPALANHIADQLDYAKNALPQMQLGNVTFLVEDRVEHLAALLRGELDSTGSNNDPSR